MRGRRKCVDGDNNDVREGEEDNMLIILIIENKMKMSKRK